MRKRSHTDNGARKSLFSFQKSSKGPPKSTAMRERSQSSGRDAFLESMMALEKLTSPLSGNGLKSFTFNAEESERFNSFLRMKKEGLPIFATEIPFAFVQIKDQVERGMQVTEHVTKFLERLADLEKKYAKELDSFVQDEMKLLQAMQTADGMKSTWKAWISLLHQTNNISQAHHMFANEVKASSIENMKSFREVGNAQLKAIVEKKARITDSMADVRSRIEKSRAKAQKAIQNAPDLSAVKEETKGLQSKDSRKMKKIMDSSVKAYEAAEKYQTDINHGNQALHAYATKEIPEILVEMQSLEELRLKSLKATYSQYANVWKQVSETIHSSTSRMAEAIEQVDSEKDIVRFVQECAAGAYSSEIFQPFEYALDVPVKAMRDLIVATTRNASANAVFRTTLDELMEKQSEYDDLQLPRIFLHLAKSIELSGGFSRQGIFRISGDHNRIKNVMLRLEGNQYDLLDSPHTAADLLKRWLRELREPLIPTEYYEICIEMGKRYDQLRPQDFYRLLEAFPKTNRMLLEELARIAKCIVANIEDTKMTFHNLAIVIGPNILRLIKPDTQKLLMNAQTETFFVEKMLEHLDLPQPSLVETYELQIGKLERDSSLLQSLDTLEISENDV